MQSLSEVRFINVARNKVHGLYTYDLGDRFLQRDIAVMKSQTLSSQWDFFMAYPRFNY